MSVYFPLIIFLDHLRYHRHFLVGFEPLTPLSLEHFVTKPSGFMIDLN